MKAINFLLCGGVCTLLLFSACAGKSNENPRENPQAYPTVVLAKEDATLESVYPATIKGKEDIEIRPRIDGFIDAIYVDEGSLVKKGQSLFKIDSPQSEQALTTAKASVSSAQAQLNTAKVNVDRIRPLAERGIVSNVQLQTYENAYQSALSSLKQAEAAVLNAQSTVDWTLVKSPVDGVVGTISYRQGSLVDKSNVLTTVANIGNVYAYFSLNEKELTTFLDNTEGNTQTEKIKNIPEVSLVLADGTTYPEKGRIETIAGSVNITTGSVNFRAEFPNKQGMLRSGTSGKIIIPRHVKDVFVIPQKAIFEQQDKVLIYQVQGDSVVQQIVSVISTPDGKNYVVTEGLKDGDRVVTDGIATLKSGKKISFR